MFSFYASFSLLLNHQPTFALEKALCCEYRLLAIGCSIECLFHKGSLFSLLVY